MGKVQSVKEVDQFDQLISDPERAVLVDFWAEWCGPCKMLSPVIERLAREYDGRMNFVKVNIDEFPEISSRYKVRSIPTTIIFRQGKAASRFTGFKPEQAFRPHLERYALQVEGGAAPESDGAEAPAAEGGGGGIFAGLRRLFGG